MLKPNMNLACILAIAVMAGAALGAEQAAAPRDEAALIAVLKSADASRKDKADACRELARVATKDAVPALAALLPNPELNHMARYGMETIADPSADDALRAALGQLKGLQLVGVIGSIGVRRDAKSIDAVAKFLADSDPVVAQAAARALGKIGTVEAAKAIEAALPSAPAANVVAFCEGLFRCAEAILAAGQKEAAIAIYDKLRALPNAPQQVRVGSLAGAIIARGNGGLPLLRENLKNKEWLLFMAAVRATHEMSGAEVTAALTGALKDLPLDGQTLVLAALAKRQDAAAIPAVAALAKSGEKAVRIPAIRTLSQIANPSAVPIFLALMDDADKDVAAAAQAAMAGMQAKEVDDAVVAMLGSDQVAPPAVGARSDRASPDDRVHAGAAQGDGRG